MAPAPVRPRKQEDGTPPRPRHGARPLGRQGAGAELARRWHGAGEGRGEEEALQAPSGSLDRSKTGILITSTLPCGQSHVSPEKGVEAFHGFSEVAQTVPRRRCL